VRLILYVGKQRGIRSSISFTPRATDSLQSLALLAMKRCGVENIRRSGNRGSTLYSSLTTLALQPER